MQFSRKLSASSHSRSSSTSSTTKVSSSISPASNSSKNVNTPVKSASKKGYDTRVPLEKSNTSHSQSSSISSYANSIGNEATIYEEVEKLPKAQLKTTVSLNDSVLRGSDDFGTLSNDEGSMNSLSFDKMILPWDPTDPEEWTISRITSWFKFYEFPDSWIGFFERHQLYGHRFIRLLAYENFVVYEKYLPARKNATYSRFQQLLKETMTKNVLHQHSRHKSIDRSKVLRASSESIKLKYKTNRSHDDIHTVRSTSDSAVTEIKAESSRAKDNGFEGPVRTNHKTKSTSSLYRRSFISLRAASSFSSTNQTNPANIKLKIPAQTHTATVLKTPTVKSVTPPPPQMSPSIFRRHQKSSSSDSSLLNFLFGNGNTVATGNSNPKFEIPSHSRNTSAETVTKSKYSSVQSSTKSSPIPSDDKAKIWEKIKRRSQINLSNNGSTPALEATKSSDSVLTLSPTKTYNSNVSPNSNIGSNSIAPLIPTCEIPKSKLDTEFGKFQKSVSKPTMIFEQKYYPSNNNISKNGRYVLITKDNKTFIPVTVDGIKSVEEFKHYIMSVASLKNKPVSFHMTDFGSEYGAGLPDDILKLIISQLDLFPFMKLYVNDQSKIQLRQRTATISSDVNTSLRSVKSKTSVKSITSSNANSIDQNSMITSSSDTTSFDEHVSTSGRRYPQTPSHFYDLSASTSNNEELNYWNIKGFNSEDNSLPKLIQKASTMHPIPDKSSLYFSSPEQNLRRANSSSRGPTGEAEFSKRQIIPIPQPELEPRREAPKAPTNISPPRIQSVTREHSFKLRRNNTRMSRKLQVLQSSSSLSPDIENIDISHTESVITSYIPGSTHVLVPQPYKGASDISPKIVSEEEIHENVFLNSKSKISYRKNSMSSIFSSRPSLLKRESSRRIVSSTYAADIFDENNINFADAPALSDSDSKESFDEIVWVNDKKDQPFISDAENQDSDSSNDIIWSKNKKPSVTRAKNVAEFHDSCDYLDDKDDIILRSPDINDYENLGRKMTLRPSPEEVYQNLEKFFPGANLDKPVLEGVTPPASPNPMNFNGIMGTSPLSDTMPLSIKIPLKPTQKSNLEASIGNSELTGKEHSGAHKLLKRTKTIRTIAHEASKARKQSHKVTRHNTKMWGTRIFEITDKQSIPINKSKNSKGEYDEFVWMKGEMIGKGSFGAVYLSLNITTGEMMAVKQVEVPKYGLQDETIASTVEALRSEVSTLKDLDHLNVVQYLGFEVKKNIYSLFVEYVAGGSVGSLIRMYGRFDDMLIRHLTNQVLKGLAYLHSKGILHRDMKADNLLLDQDGVCKISDFGISRKSNDIYSNSEMTMRGTVFWMAPEMVDTKQGYSAKVDIWSLGCIVLEMFAGKRPWSNFEVVAAMFKIGQVKSAPPIPEDTLPLISEIAKNFIDKCFEVNPEKRPTADKLLSHKFSIVPEQFNFKTTELAKFIKSNDKLNSSKLRVSSQENK